MTHWTVARQAPQTMGFSQQRILVWVDIPPRGDLLDPGIKPAFPVSPALQMNSLPAESVGNAMILTGLKNFFFGKNDFLFFGQDC